MAWTQTNYCGCQHVIYQRQESNKTMQNIWGVEYLSLGG